HRERSRRMGVEGAAGRRAEGARLRGPGHGDRFGGVRRLSGSRTSAGRAGVHRSLTTRSAPLRHRSGDVVHRQPVSERSRRRSLVARGGRARKAPQRCQCASASRPLRLGGGGKAHPACMAADAVRGRQTCAQGGEDRAPNSGGLMQWSEWDRCPPGTSLRDEDPDIARLIEQEIERQNDGLELIASENFVSPAVLEAMGSPLTNKYAEGLPRKRYYGGCEFVDGVEELAIARAKELFGADHANVQPHSGATANAAVYLAFMKPGDTLLGLDLSNGGHLTHGSPVNSSGILYNAVHYSVDDNGIIDYDRMEELAREHRPRMIVAGYSAYSRVRDYERFARAARDVEAIFMVDMAHFAGLVAAGAYPSPVPHADVVTTATHKTLRGPRGGLILCRAEHQKAVDKAMFPGTQGGPLMHVIAAKAVSFREALKPEFRQYSRQVVANARALAGEFVNRGFDVVSGGTD